MKSKPEIIAFCLSLCGDPFVMPQETFRGGWCLRRLPGTPRGTIIEKFRGGLRALEDFRLHGALLGQHIPLLVMIRKTIIFEAHVCVQSSSGRLFVEVIYDSIECYNELQVFCIK